MWARVAENSISFKKSEQGILPCSLFNWRFSLNKPSVLLGEIKNTSVNKNLRVKISEGLATASLKITGGF